MRTLTEKRLRTRVLIGAKDNATKIEKRRELEKDRDTKKNERGRERDKAKINKKRTEDNATCGGQMRSRADARGKRGILVERSRHRDAPRCRARAGAAISNNNYTSSGKVSLRTHIRAGEERRKRAAAGSESGGGGQSERCELPAGGTERR